ncbi:hypothetical protein GV794_10740 [Nocardia cyriacigeorgica]|uniref:Uncharacterized protein n=1 Tax=Nocardia cyriacigeorgica TaxID=135487 RepID=A0ABX0CHU7_9NOCA|nr:DUF6463 family protein [Nocardia cyriacigeorgica]NEW37743.1 hypothetical protein [Nocardia cyriacigeorgica]NEW48871.1 hypothetical protein [Nocardia cyriacigeorgica]NEW56125.1 hypothetical protein [Nocardia cyriacigeorgica]
MINWAGRILAFLGAVHLTAATVFSYRHFAEWLSFGLWSLDADITELPAPIGGFWFGPGSFGAPLLLLGVMVIWMDRRAITPPAFLALALLAWTAVCALIFEPAPWVAATAAAVMLLVGIRRAGSPASTATREVARAQR